MHGWMDGWMDGWRFGEASKGRDLEYGIMEYGTNSKGGRVAYVVVFIVSL